MAPLVIAAMRVDGSVTARNSACVIAGAPPQYRSFAASLRCEPLTHSTNR